MGAFIRKYSAGTFTILVYVLLLLAILLLSLGKQ